MTRSSAPLLERGTPRSEDAPGERLRVLMACSTGGHLAQLYTLKPWWRRHDRVWVTFDKADARGHLAGEKVVWAHHPTTRNIPNTIRNFFLALRVVRRYRPDIVVSDGAGVALPFFVAAKLFRVPTVYIEVFERIDRNPTLTGRLCYPMSDLFLLQWEEQRRMYPKGVVIGPLL